ncbi:MAG: HDIG domain-containing protein [Paludibacteraceae bacterium]|nr:HDIG domain-containing protein [Paludibacteraceae bacterium]
MNISVKKDTWRLLLRVALFLVAIALLVQLFPSENKFKYTYQNHKPWRYGLLTAPFDFFVYKDAERLKNEQDSILRNVLPYYDFDAGILRQSLKSFWRSVANTETDSAAQQYKDYVVSQLQYVYSHGLIPSKDMEKFAENGVTNINVVKDFVASAIPVSELFTVKSAYSYILNHCPSELDVQVLKSYNLNRYLNENLLYDAKRTEQMRAEALKGISPTMGYVQTGERIIDKGEVVNDRTFLILNSLKKETEGKVLSGKRFYLLLFGQVLLISTLMLALFFYLYLFRRKIYSNFRSMLFLLMMLLLMVTLLAFGMRYARLSLYLLPFAFLPIVVRAFFDSRTTFFIHIVMTLLCSVFVPNPYEFILLQLAAGIAVICSMKDMTQRSQLLQTIVLVILVYSLVYLSYSLIMGLDLSELHYMVFVYFVINGVLLLFSYGVIYICERVFGFLSNMTLIELSNVNNSLLMKFSEMAPGTFQHSLQVANLATEAAARINANSLLVRTGALYHDIGKMANPLYFIENQSGKLNPLDGLKCEDAAQLIISHVNEGVKIAQKNKIPDQIINFIRTHHAQSKTRYFYNTYRNEHPGEEVNEKMFTYAGPKPFTKEMAVLMMADAVEAASRSLPEYTETTIDKMVDNIIDGQITDGSFKNAPITFLHIEIIKSVFKQKLKNIYHSRITYPELVEKNK